MCCLLSQQTSESRGPGRELVCGNLFERSSTLRVCGSFHLVPRLAVGIMPQHLFDGWRESAIRGPQSETHTIVIRLYDLSGETRRLTPTLLRSRFDLLGYTGLGLGRGFSEFLEALCVVVTHVAGRGDLELWRSRDWRDKPRNA